MLLIDDVAGIHLGRSLTSQQRFKGLIDQGGIGYAGVCRASTGKKLFVDRCAQSCATHATSMPLTVLWAVSIVALFGTSNLSRHYRQQAGTSETSARKPSPDFRSNT